MAIQEAERTAQVACNRGGVIEFRRVRSLPSRVFRAALPDRSPPMSAVGEGPGAISISKLGVLGCGITTAVYMVRCEEEGTSM
jgi:hypothetical protein